jgi:hypothetical protein
MGLSNKLIRQLPARKDYSTLEDFIVSLVRFLIFAISRALVAGRRCLSLAGSYWMGRNMVWSLLDGILLLSSLLLSLRKKMASSAMGKSNTDCVLGIRI